MTARSKTAHTIFVGLLHLGAGSCSWMQRAADAAKIVLQNSESQVARQKPI